MDGLTSEDPVRVDRYRLLRRLGAGGMGTVYLASGPGGDLVALKAIHASRAREPEFRRRFDREALAVMRVADRWIPPFEAAGREGDVPWLATRYVPALSLAEAVEEYGALPADACWWMLNCLVSALSTVHGAGLVHRDLKPANVLLTDDGALLIDFGIAHTPTDTRLTATGHFIGSAGYGAPETVRGEEVSGQADVFALGGVLTYAASGQPPFGRGTYEAVVARSLTADPMTDGIGNAELRALARACLAKDPGRRAALGTVAASVRAATAGRGAGRWPWLPVALHARIRARADEAAAAATPPTRPGQQATETATARPATPPGAARTPHPPTEPATPRTRTAPTEPAAPRTRTASTEPAAPRTRTASTEPAPPAAPFPRPPLIARRTVVKATLAVAATGAGGAAAVRALRETPQEKADRQEQEAEAAALAARTVWKTEGAGGYSPAVDQNTAYVPGIDGVLRAVRLSDGTELWRTGKNYEALSSPVVLADGVAAVFNLRRRQVRAVSTDQGQDLWSHSAAGSLFSEGERLYFHTDQDVCCVSPKDGRTIWSVPTRELIDVRDQVHYGDGALAFLTEENGLTGRALADDAEAWHRPMPYTATLVVSGGSVMALGPQGLSVFDAGTGTTRWTYDWAGPKWTGPSTYRPTARGPVLYLSDGDKLLALDTARRKQLWNVDQAAFSIRCVTADTVYGWGHAGDLVAVATADGSQRWRIPGSSLDQAYGSNAPLTVVGDLLYTSSGARLGCFDTASPRQRWSVRFFSMRDPVPAGELLIGSVPNKDYGSGVLYAIKR